DPRTDLDLFGGAVAADRSNFRELAATFSGLDAGAIARDPERLLRAVSELSRLIEPGGGVVGSGAAGLVFGWNGLAFGIGDVVYAGVYPNVDLTHILPGSDPANGFRFNETA